MYWPGFTSWYWPLKSCCRSMLGFSVENSFISYIVVVGYGVVVDKILACNLNKFGVRGIFVINDRALFISD